MNQGSLNNDRFTLPQQQTNYRIAREIATPYGITCVQRELVVGNMAGWNYGLIDTETGLIYDEMTIKSTPRCDR